VKRQMPQDGAAEAVATTVETTVEVAVTPRDMEDTVRVVVVRFPGPGVSWDPRKSHDVRFGASQNPAGTVPLSFALPLRESSCNEDGRVDGNAVYAFASRKLRRKGNQNSSRSEKVVSAHSDFSDVK
jgi:hypothetical protein